MDAGTYKESGIEIKKEITLQGNGNPEDVIIDAEKKDVIIKSNSSKLTIKNITFMNAFNIGNGGAISFYSTGELTVENCIFLNNNVKFLVSGEAQGGAIYINGTNNKFATSKIINCTFINNSALTDGGAINTRSANTYITNCIFDNNIAARDGGAISTRGYSKINIENSIFTNNYAEEWGGAINNWLSEFTINYCIFTENKAGFQGGALESCGPFMSVINCEIKNNTAIEEGGAIHIHKDTDIFPPKVIMNYNEIIGNTAKTGSIIFIQKGATDNFNFNYNYWGCTNPNSTNWSSAFVTNNVCGNPSQWHNEKVSETIYASDITRAYNSPYDFTATFLGKYGQPLANNTVNFIVNDKIYEIITDENGVGKLALKLAVGSYKITAINTITGENLTRNVKIVSRISENNDLTKDYLDSKTYKLCIIGDDGKAVGSRISVSVVLNGVKYTLKTDKNGYITKTINLVAGKYFISTTYKGQTVKNKITVKQILKSKNVSVKVKKTIKVQATLKYSNGKALKNKKITFKFKGKTYTAKTNSKGIATKIIKNTYKPGKYTLNIRYVNQIIKKTVTIKR